MARPVQLDCQSDGITVQLDRRNWQLTSVWPTGEVDLTSGELRKKRIPLEALIESNISMAGFINSLASRYCVDDVVLKRKRRAIRNAEKRAIKSDQDAAAKKQAEPVPEPYVRKLGYYEPIGANTSPFIYFKKPQKAGQLRLEGTSKDGSRWIVSGEIVETETLARLYPQLRKDFRRIQQAVIHREHFILRDSGATFSSDVRQSSSSIDKPNQNEYLAFPDPKFEEPEDTFLDNHPGESKPFMYGFHLYEFARPAAKKPADPTINPEVRKSRSAANQDNLVSKRAKKAKPSTENRSLRKTPPVAKLERSDSQATNSIGMVNIGQWFGLERLDAVSRDGTVWQVNGYKGSLEELAHDMPGLFAEFVMRSIDVIGSSRVIEIKKRFKHLFSIVKSTAYLMESDSGKISATSRTLNNKTRFIR
ncbi:hypothetical protein IHN63_02805 [Deinococcus sp. 6YEL10]|uniref:hypothetical protein n=1 Tax=Deinococcus sp. 6YEL10 TaxID=2745870 RepID=UPI001E36ACC0|nr:hypothetical protein [Deinococcus sp. 6YEL10]MCD0160229.1 hypothetical protein [Deinococcus sp. 6YEL10]